NRIDYGQFDSLAAAIDYGHSIGLKIHAWATINEDDHGWGWASEFAKAHPEYRWVRRDGTPYRSQLSFAFPEVREYKLGLIKELLAYDIDGMLLDWIRTGDVRDNPQTDAQGVADSGYEPPNVSAFRRRYKIDPEIVANDDDRWVRVRAEPQTMFMRDVRTLVEEHDPPPSKGGARGGINSTDDDAQQVGPGRSHIPIAVMVGHPWHYRGLQDPIDGNLRGLLLDVKTWAEEGLMDAAIAAGYYRAGGSADSAYRALEEETGGNVDLWYYAWVPQTVEEFEGQFASAQSLGAERPLLGSRLHRRPPASRRPQSRHERPIHIARPSWPTPAL
ncbi:MAG TPA: family 10 glycosylhydrolase, partial [Lacipirellula sp.]